MKAYQLKIQIKNSHPPIWRRVIVSAGLSFSQLSAILNEVMGWCGYHLSAFEFCNLKVWIEDMEEDYADWGFGEYDVIQASETMIDPYLDSEEWFTYIYDFGDDWQHRVTIEKVLDDYDANYAQVLKYKGETPYEDCGGLGRYYELLDILKNPKHPEYEEVKEWTSGHFTEKYDIAAVNQRLKKMYLSDEKSGFMAQDEIRLKDILCCYQKKELSEIAKVHRLSGYTKYNKKDLCDFLCRELLDKDVMLRYFKYLSEPEMKLLEAKEIEQEIDNIDDSYDYLLEGGYAGYSLSEWQGIVVVPPEIKKLYREYCNEEWKKSRKKDLIFLQHLNAAAALFGVCSIETVLSMYKKNTGKTKDELSVILLWAEAPDNKKLFTLKENRVLLKEVDSPEKEQVLLERQCGKEFYMPTLKEVEYFDRKGFFPFDWNMNQLQTYFVQEGNEEPEDAELMCGVIQSIIRNGGSMQDIMDFLEYECLEYDFLMENDRKVEKLIDRLQKVWNSTRMVLNRGYTPDELFGRKMIGKNQESNVIPFSKARAKKMYPNDPCPCGSGKKYKNCCGKR